MFVYIQAIDKWRKKLLYLLDYFNNLYIWAYKLKQLYLIVYSIFGLIKWSKIKSPKTSYLVWAL